MEINLRLSDGENNGRVHGGGRPGHSSPEARFALAAELLRLAEVFRLPITEGLAEEYAEALKDFDITEIREAVRVAISSCRFFPVPAELIEMMRQRRREARQQHELAQRQLVLERSSDELERERTAIDQARGGFRDLVDRVTAKFRASSAMPVKREWPQVSEEEIATHRARKSAQIDRMRAAGLLPPRDETA